MESTDECAVQQETSGFTLCHGCGPCGRLQVGCQLGASATLPCGAAAWAHRGDECRSAWGHRRHPLVHENLGRDYNGTLGECDMMAAEGGLVRLPVALQERSGLPLPMARGLRVSLRSASGSTCTFSSHFILLITFKFMFKLLKEKPEITDPCRQCRCRLEVARKQLSRMTSSHWHWQDLRVEPTLHCQVGVTRIRVLPRPGATGTSGISLRRCSPRRHVLDDAVHVTVS
jgi:hypothetical protein